MDWLNLHVSTLDSPEFIGAEPLDRATWLCLLRYCVGQENGGRIGGAKSWGDRRWQQLARVTASEVARETDLWRWLGEDLIVNGYPKAKERQVRAGRKNATAGAMARWSSHDEGQGEGMGKGMHKGMGKPNAEGEEEGEGEGKGKGITPPAPPGRGRSDPGPLVAQAIELAGGRVFGKDNRATWVRLVESSRLDVVIEAIKQVLAGGDEAVVSTVSRCVQGTWTPKPGRAPKPAAKDTAPAEYTLSPDQLALIDDLEGQIAEQGENDPA